MDPFEVYKTYVAVKLHFLSPVYDFVESGGRARAVRKSLDKRRDKAFFEKIARTLPPSHLVPFMVANFVENPNSWIGDLANADDALETFNAWRRRMVDLRGNITYDVRNIQESLVDSGKLGWKDILTDHRGFPEAFRFLRRSMICNETWIFFDRRYGVVQGCSETTRTDPVFSATTFRLDKYSRFLHQVDWDGVAEAVSRKVPQFLPRWA